MRLTRKSIKTTLAGLFVLSLYGVGPVVMGLNLMDMAQLEPGDAGTAEDYSALVLSGEDLDAMMGDLDGVPEATEPEPVPEEVAAAPPPPPPPTPEAIPVEAPPTPEAEVAVADPEPAPEPAADAEGAEADPNHPGRMTREERLARLGEADEGKSTANRPKKKRNCAEDLDSIEMVEEGFYKVERELVDYYTNDIQEAMKLAYVSWHRNEQDEIVGFKVKRIKCNSVLYQAGFRNGDIILSINDKPVTTIPQALLAYRKLRKKNRLEVEVIRKDQPIHLKYKLT